MNYEKLNEELHSTEVAKFNTGIYEVEIMSEMEFTEFLKDDGTKVPQIKLLICENGKSKMWYVTKAKTTKSVYGQLVIIGKEKGILKGERITLIVAKGKDGMNTYTIPQAIKILQQQEVVEELI